MTDAEALAEAIRRTGHARYRDLVDPTHPDYQPAYWQHIYRAAGVERPKQYPPLLEQAGNALAAAGRAIASGLQLVDDAEHARRLAICEGCEHYDGDRHRCRKCGCWSNLKAKLASEKCPMEKW